MELSTFLESITRILEIKLSNKRLLRSWNSMLEILEKRDRRISIDRRPKAAWRRTSKANSTEKKEREREREKEKETENLAPK